MRGGRRSAAGRPMIAVSLVAAVTVLLLGGAGARAATRNQPAAKAQPTFANFAAPSGGVQDPIGCGPGVYVDHQTVGGGPYAPPLVGTPAYADATYYCAQAEVEASCAMSPDGGLTFDPAVPIYTTECIGLHGHLKVAPDG